MTWLEKYGHGGDTLTAASVFGIESSSFLDFSANINPLGPPKRVMEQLQQELQAIIHYPDPAQRLLRSKLSERLSVPSSYLLIGNGAAECMMLALLAFQPKKVGVIYPCFSEYEKLALAYDATIISCTGLLENSYKPLISDVLQLVQEADLTFIGHPNNPTGLLYTKDELIQIAEEAGRSGTYVVVDEAFLDFVPEAEQQTLLHDVDAYPNIILIRSMTKFYAIPGLRLGYAIAHPSRIEEMGKKQVTWSVNQLALTAGLACLEELAYEEETIQLISEQREYLKRKLETELGLFVFPSKVNFLLVRLPASWLAADLQWRMGEKGILIRSCAMYAGLTEHDFRIAVRTQKENDQLLDVLQDILQGE